jgi:hypothetical protein
MRRRRREHSLLLKASKILVSLGASVNLTLSHRRRALRSFPLRRRGAAGSDQSGSPRAEWNMANVETIRSSAVG